MITLNLLGSSASEVTQKKGTMKDSILDGSESVSSDLKGVEVLFSPLLMQMLLTQQQGSGKNKQEGQLTESTGNVDGNEIQPGPKIYFSQNALSGSVLVGEKQGSATAAEKSGDGQTSVDPQSSTTETVSVQKPSITLAKELLLETPENVEIPLPKIEIKQDTKTNLPLDLTNVSSEKNIRKDVSKINVVAIESSLLSKEKGTEKVSTDSHKEIQKNNSNISEKGDANITLNAEDKKTSVLAAVEPGVKKDPTIQTAKLTVIGDQKNDASVQSAQSDKQSFSVKTESKADVQSIPKETAAENSSNRSGNETNEKNNSFSSKQPLKVEQPMFSLGKEIDQTAGKAPIPKTDLTTLLQKTETVNSMMEQLANHISVSVDEKNSHMSVVLKPEALGEVTLRVKIEEGKVSSQMEVQQPQVKTAIESNIAVLKEALGSKGLSVDRIEVFTSQQSSNDKSFHNNQQWQRSKTNNKDVEEEDLAEISKSMGYNTMEYII